MKTQVDRAAREVARDVARHDRRETLSRDRKGLRRGAVFVQAWLIHAWIAARPLWSLPSSLTTASSVKCWERAVASRSRSAVKYPAMAVGSFMVIGATSVGALLQK